MNARVRNLLLLMIVLLLFIYVAVCADNVRLQEARSAAFVQECRQRPHVWVTLDGVTWDLNACG